LTTTTDGPLQERRERAHRIPGTDHFPGVDEIRDRLDDLAGKHPDLVTRRRIGTSRLGEPILMYSIGTGPDEALVYAGVHPNEPIGFWTAIRLAEDLCADPSLLNGIRWNIIGCIDPDGTRLNEGWFAGPWDRVHYLANFYRPAPAEQVEWSFPFQYKDAYFDQVMPEAFALMRAIVGCSRRSRCRCTTPSSAASTTTSPGSSRGSSASCTRSRDPSASRWISVNRRHRSPNRSARRSTR
jgi:hypothetical protein